MSRLGLAWRISKIHAVQPATALWRVFEVEVVRARLNGGGRALDLGCGDGSLATLLFENVSTLEWTGLDLNERDVSLARHRDVYTSLVVGSAAAIPAADASFDLVFSNSALEHMPALDTVIGEVARVLKPGGRLVFTVPSASFRGQLLWPRLLRSVGLASLARAYVEHIDRRIAHVNYLSAEEWVLLLDRHGLVATSTVPYLSRNTVAAWETLSNATGGLAYALVRGRKTPRDIQLASGLLQRPIPGLATLGFVAMLPFYALATTDRDGSQSGALYVEAIKEARAR